MASFCRTPIDFNGSSECSAAPHSTHNTRAFSSICTMKCVILLKVTTYQERAPLHAAPTPFKVAAEFPNATWTANKTIELLVVDIKGNSGRWMNSAFLHLLSALWERRASRGRRLHQAATNKHILKAVKGMGKSAQWWQAPNFLYLALHPPDQCTRHFCCSRFLSLRTLNLISLLVSFMIGTWPLQLYD